MLEAELGGKRLRDATANDLDRWLGTTGQAVCHAGEMRRLRTKVEALEKALAERERELVASEAAASKAKDDLWDLKVRVSMAEKLDEAYDAVVEALVPFTPSPECPKCDSRDHSVKAKSSVEVFGDGPDPLELGPLMRFGTRAAASRDLEYLELTCNRCGHRGYMETADSDA